jgi:TonB family protein
MTLKLNREALTAAPPNGAREHDDETTWVTFPKEFEKSLTDFFDRRFAMIWLLTIAVELISIAYLVSRPQAGDIKVSKGLIDRLVSVDPDSAREVSFVDIMPAPDLAPPQSSGGSFAVTGNRRGPSAPDGGAPAGGEAIAGVEGHYRVPVASNRRTREDISSAASRAGILGLLTSNSNEATGRAVEDVLGGSNAPMANLDDALANAGALRRGSTRELGKSMGPGGDVAGDGTGNGREVRGSRATNAGGIDALVQGLGEGKSQGVQRSGGLEVGMNEPLIEEPSEDGKATGTRDRDAVAAVVARHTSAIQFCYQREIKRNPNLKGKLVVRFVITPQGTIASVTILSSTLNNPTVESCIIERIKRWDDFGAIDPSKGNTTFRQVYTFGY